MSAGYRYLRIVTTSWNNQSTRVEFSVDPAPTPSRWQRFRLWVALRLVRLARRISP